MNQLVKLGKAVNALAEARTLDEIKEVHDTGKALGEYARAANLGLEAQNHATIITSMARRKGGALLDSMPTEQGRRNDVTSSKAWEKLPTKQQAIQEVGLKKSTAHNWETEARIPEEIVNNYFQEKIDNNEEITLAGIRRLNSSAHVAHATGENEWYTPPEYTDAARRVMGGIDLDPASSDIANKSVKATAYYTEEDDGLAWDWEGRIWMNPPYAQPLISHFCEKLTWDLDNGFIIEAITLTNNATETKWYQGMASRCSAKCEPAGRIKFIDKDGNPGGAPLQGQVILYFGPSTKVDKFAAEFSKFGMIFYAR